MLATRVVRVTQKTRVRVDHRAKVRAPKLIAKVRVPEHVLQVWAASHQAKPTGAATGTTVAERKNNATPL